jgi:hypothetical protein
VAGTAPPEEARPSGPGTDTINLVSISTEDLLAVVARARAAAEAAGELRPAHVGPVQSNFPEGLRVAAGEDLVSGAYHRAAREAVAGDPDVTQG